MEPNNNFDISLIDNAHVFDNEFFKRHQDNLKNIPIQLNDSILKNYQFPSFYGNVACAIGIFFCDFNRAQEVLPDSNYQPIKMLKNRSIVIFSSYEYRDVSGIVGYNEIGMTIPVFYKKSAPPVLPLMKKSMKGFGYHVFSMPVTSLENQLRGLRIWGMPKVVERIDIEQDHHYNFTTAFDEDGRKYFSLRVPLNGKEQVLDEKNWLYSKLENDALITESNLYGKFNVNKFSSRILSNSSKDKSDCLYIGNSKRAEQLRYLNINPNPLQFRYSNNMSSCVDYPKAV